MQQKTTTMTKNNKIEESKKERRQRKRAEAIQGNQTTFDIINLLQHENLETKPNFAKFLETYVKDVRVCVGSKIQFYPTLKYDTRKIFVTFLDGHELVMFVKLDFPT